MKPLDGDGPPDEDRTRNVRTPERTDLNPASPPLERNTVPDIPAGDLPTLPQRVPRPTPAETKEAPTHTPLGALLPERFELIRKMGSGGMGWVFAAQDKKLGRMVAIKRLRDEHLKNKEANERFFREAKLLAQLDDPGIVKVYELLETDGCLVMELVEGENLHKRLKREGPLPAAEVKRIAVEAARVLDVVHKAGLVHRDVKPENFILTADGRLKLVDFGVAWADDMRLTKQGYTIGTPGYMSPEQLRGQAVDARTDFYALGATLYELATGEMLNPAEGPRRTLVDRLRLLPDPELRAWIARSVEPEPEHRASDSTAFLPAIPTQPTRRSRRRRLLGLGVIALLALAAGAFAWLWLRPPRLIYVEPAGANPASDRTLAAVRAALHHSDVWVVEPNANQAERRLSVSDTSRPDAKVVRVELATMDGEVERSADATVKYLLPEVAAAALTCQLAAESGAACHSYRPSPARNNPKLRKGVALLEAGSVNEARVAVMQAQSEGAPADDGAYYAAFTSWWVEEPREQVFAQIANAKSLNDGARSYFLDGLGQIERSDNEPAAQTFLTGLAKFPDDLDLLYGVTEAWHHGGHPDQALEAHLLLRRASPTLRLALVHAFDLALVRDDAKTYDFLALAPDVIADPDFEQWTFRRHLVRGEYDAMADWLARSTLDPERLTVVESRKVADVFSVSLATGRLDVARRATALSVASRLSPASVTLALAVAEGDAETVRGLRQAISDHWDRFSSDKARFGVGLDNELLLLPELSAKELADSSAWLAGLDVPDRVRLSGAQWEQVIAAGRLEHRDPLEALQQTGYPVVREAATAYLARLDHRPAEAAAHFGAALALLGDSRYFFLLRWERAESLFAAGDDEGAVKACQGVLEPWTAHASSAGYVAPCLSLSVRAKARHADAPGAKALLERLEALRPKADASDRWLAPARAALGK